MPCDDPTLAPPHQRTDAPLALSSLGEAGSTAAPPLHTLYLYIAGACNLACRHCWIAPGFDPEARGGRFIPLEYVEKAVREAKPLGLASVKLTGGEPMLHPRFREIVSFVAKEGVSMVM